jgi:DNA-binding phage protein
VRRTTVLLVVERVFDSMDLMRSIVKWLRARGYGPAMPGRRGLDGPPISFVPAHPDRRWDEVDLPDGTPAPVVAVQELVRRLRAAMGERSARAVAADAGLQHTTLLALLRGERWPDMATVVKLEQALDVDLWPGRL